MNIQARNEKISAELLATLFLEFLLGVLGGVLIYYVGIRILSPLVSGIGNVLSGLFIFEDAGVPGYVRVGGAGPFFLFLIFVASVGYPYYAGLSLSTLLEKLVIARNVFDSAWAKKMAFVSGITAYVVFALLAFQNSGILHPTSGVFYYLTGTNNFFSYLVIIGEIVVFCLSVGGRMEYALNEQIAKADLVASIAKRVEKQEPVTEAELQNALTTLDQLRNYNTISWVRYTEYKELLRRGLVQPSSPPFQSPSASSPKVSYEQDVNSHTSPPVFGEGKLKHTLGLETLGGVTTPFLNRGTLLPADATQILSTASDNQSEVEIHLVLGDNIMSGDNVSLARLFTDNLPPSSRGTLKIFVGVHVDADMKLTVTVREKSTGYRKGFGAIDLASYT